MNHPDTLTLLAKRRSVAPLAMTGPAPSEAELEQLLTLAARVPDHGKLVPWRFLVFAGEARARAGAIAASVFQADNPEADDARLKIEMQRFARAPLVVGVVSRAAPHVKIPEWEQVLSAGAVCMNLTIAAHAMGFVTAWLTEWVAYDRRVLDKLGLAAHETIAGFVHIGHAAHVPEDRVRPVMANIITHFSDK